MPYMKNGKRDYKKEKAWDHNHDGGQRLKDRAERNKARSIMEKAGKVHKGDGKQVDHKKELIRGGSNSTSNLRVVTDHTNLHKEGLRKQRVAKKK